MTTRPHINIKNSIYIYILLASDENDCPAVDYLVASWSNVVIEMCMYQCADCGSLDSIEARRLFYTDMKTVMPYVRPAAAVILFYHVNRRPNLPAYRYSLKTERGEVYC